MRDEGLEPPWIAPPGSKPGASAISPIPRGFSDSFKE
ncbi:MAG: hypothetical protein JWQ35_1003 [Bacteriovoracaceae bacterium]|nr:hypothetical protein [Bacteriovoracaceae bacterium]